jgi:hypothetical protein
MGLDRCRIIKYSGLSNSGYTDKSSYSKLLPLLYLDYTINQRIIPFRYLLHLLVQRHRDPFLVFVESLKLLPGMLKDQETGDMGSS